jgi:hypothetical protein
MDVNEDEDGGGGALIGMVRRKIIKCRSFATNQYPQGSGASSR